MTFRVGQMVVCIDDSKWQLVPPWSRLPYRGEVLTIQSIFRGLALDGLQMGLRFEEIQNGRNLEGIEVGYPACRFRPIVDTDISIFQKMLVPVSGKKINETVT